MIIHSNDQNPSEDDRGLGGGGLTSHTSGRRSSLVSVVGVVDRSGVCICEQHACGQQPNGITRPPWCHIVIQLTVLRYHRNAERVGRELPVLIRDLDGLLKVCFNQIFTSTPSWPIKARWSSTMYCSLLFILHVPSP